MIARVLGKQVIESNQKRIIAPGQFKNIIHLAFQFILIKKTKNAWSFTGIWKMQINKRYFLFKQETILNEAASNLYTLLRVIKESGYKIYRLLVFLTQELEKQLMIDYKELLNETARTNSVGKKIWSF